MDEEPGTMPGSLVFRWLFACLAASALALAGIGPTGAHGGAPSIEVVPSTLAVGGSTTVYGDDLSPGVSGVLHLLTGRGEVVVGGVEVAPDGHFTAAIQVPGDLPPRIYEVRLTDDTGLTFSTFITVEVPATVQPNLLQLIVAIVGAAIAIGVLIWALRSPWAIGRR